MRDPVPPPPKDRDTTRGWEHETAAVPLAVYLWLAAIVIAIVLHGLVTAQPRRCVAWQERPSLAVEVRR